MRVNLADNLLRDFEERWWKCCRVVRTSLHTCPCMRASSTWIPANFLRTLTSSRIRPTLDLAQADEETMAAMLQHSQRTLANVVDENRRRYAAVVFKPVLGLHTCRCAGACPILHANHALMWGRCAAACTMWRGRAT